MPGVGYSLQKSPSVQHVAVENGNSVVGASGKQNELFLKNLDAKKSKNSTSKKSTSSNTGGNLDTSDFN